MNANIMNSQILHLNKYDLIGHWWSHKVTFMFKIHFYKIFFA